eukprot:9893145-Alexandrium_andersonii.AAC.1
MGTGVSLGCGSAIALSPSTSALRAPRARRGVATVATVVAGAPVGATDETTAGRTSDAMADRNWP